MSKAYPVADVFIDTNILKFSAVKHHVYRQRIENFNWGGVVSPDSYYEPYTTNNLNLIQNDTQKRDAVFLGMLAYAGISRRLKFHTHREVDFETWGLLGMFSASGRFFGCPLHKVGDPIPPTERILISGRKTFKEHKLEFLGGIQHRRFIELTKMTGAYQGSRKPLNLNQAIEAYLIWCAECAEMDYFLTMDYKLQRVIQKSKVTTSVAITTPDQLLREILPKFGITDAIKFLWQGYRFAKPRVGFNAGKGWR